MILMICFNRIFDDTPLSGYLVFTQYCGLSPMDRPKLRPHRLMFALMEQCPSEIVIIGWGS